MISVKQIYKTYRSKDGGDCIAVDGISLDFDQTGLCFVVGKSGSGKSTLLNLMSGMDIPDSGDIAIADKLTRDFTQNDYDAYRNNYVGYIFQDFGLIDELSVGENVALSLELQGISPNADDIEQALKRVGLGEYALRRTSELSGGQRQRVSIARALLKKSKIIFADEPTGSLDAVTGRQILDIFKQLSETSLIIIVSHDIDSSLRYADRIITLSDGKVVSDKVKDGSVDLDALKKEYDQKVDLAFDDYVHKQRECGKFVVQKSTIPLKVATKMSLSNIKRVKIRFVFAIFLSMVALTLFCLVDTMRTYNYQQATLINLRQNNVKTVMLSKYNTVVDQDGNKSREYVELPLQDIQDSIDPLGDNFAAMPLGLNILPYVHDQDSTNTRLVVEMDFENLGDYYDASLLCGSFPTDIEYGYLTPIPIMLSEYVADKIMGVGGIFDNGTVLPNVGYQELLEKEFFSNGLKLKVVGIYSIDYKNLLGQNPPRVKQRFYLQYVLNSVLTYNNAIAKFANAQMFSPLDITMSFDDFQNYSSTTAIAIDTGMLSLYQILTLANANKDIVKFCSEYQDIPLEQIKLKDDEMIISFENLGLLKDWQGITDFYSLNASDFDGDIVAQFSNNLLGAQRQPYFKPIKIVGVFDNGSIDISSLQNLFPQIDHIQVANFMFLNGSTRQAFVEASRVFVGAFLSIDKSDSDTLAMFKTLATQNIDTLSYMQQDLLYIDQLFDILGNILGYSSIGLFLFVVLLVFNFMSSSIANKKKELGILRVMGAKGRDTAKIFVAEGLFLFVITILLSIAMTIFGVGLLNGELTKRFLTISKVVFFGPLTALWALLAFAATIILASAVPLLRIVKLRPIDAVKNN